MKIMIVDDEPLNIGVLTNALKSSYEICSAENGFDAISLIKEEQPDLVLLDIMMPELDGFEVCRIIRSDASFADTPIIFVTALDSQEGEAQGLELGAVDYITKPVNIELAKLRIHNQLELKHYRNVIREQNVQLTLRNEELEKTLARIKRLEGIITICSYCKKARTDDMTWQQVEQYVREHSDALFSHSICPDCLEEQLQDLHANMQK